jgi:hypothetical protein
MTLINLSIEPSTMNAIVSVSATTKNGGMIAAPCMITSDTFVLSCGPSSSVDRYHNENDANTDQTKKIIIKLIK